MALSLPSLDDRTYADLLDEAMGLIPVHDPAWTNHNPSDPGVTLLELFAWLVEMMIYGLDQITDAHRVTFLRLLNGPDWPANGVSPAGDGLDAETAAALKRLREPFRAVTVEDHELLARQARPEVRRALCVPLRDLEAPNEARRRAPAPGHVSVVVVSEGVSVGSPVVSIAGHVRAAITPAMREPDETLCRDVRTYFDLRRLLTTRLHVVPVTMVPVSTWVVVVPRSDSHGDTVAEAVAARLAAWFDPLSGGDGTGWPFARPIYLSELYALVESVRGVDAVPAIRVDGAPGPGTPSDQRVETLWRDDRDPVGVALAPHQLPLAAHEVHCVRGTVPALIDVPLDLVAGATEGAAARAVATALDAFVRATLTGKDSAKDTVKVTAGLIQSMLLGVASVAAVAQVRPVTLSPDVVDLSSGMFLDATYRITMGTQGP